MTTAAKRLLMITTSHGELGSSGKATGVWFPEICKALEVFETAGIEVVFASPRGGQFPIEPSSVPKGASSSSSSSSSSSLTTINATPLARVEASDYRAVFVAGGIGATFDLPQDKDVKRVMEAFITAKKPIATVCNGAAALLNLTDTARDGHLFVAGRHVTSFTDAEERQALGDDVKHLPLSLEQELCKRGALFSSGPPSCVHTTRNADYELLCGQNSSSVRTVASLLLNAICRCELKESISTFTKSAAALAMELKGKVWESRELHRVNLEAHDAHLYHHDGEDLYRRMMLKVETEGKSCEMLVDIFKGKLATDRVFSLHYEGGYHVAAPESAAPNPDGSFPFEWYAHRICLIPQSEEFIEKLKQCLKNQNDPCWCGVEWEVGVPVDISAEGIPGVHSVAQRPIEHDICALGTTNPARSPEPGTETVLLFGEKGWSADHPKRRRARLDPIGFHRSDFETWTQRMCEAIRMSESRLSLLRRVAIIGGGEAGTALFEAFKSSGFRTTMGDHRAMTTSSAKPEAVPTEEAAAPADVIILAVPTQGLSEAIETIDFTGKIVIDVTNPAGPLLTHEPPSGCSSNGDFIAKHARGWRSIFKAFNGMGAENYLNPVAFPSGIRKDLYICGTEGEDKRWLTRVCRQILGFNVVNLGELEFAHLVEEHGNFWMQLAKGPAHKGMRFGFTTVE